jgi:nitrogen-specific signal transduction histidine kinase
VEIGVTTTVANGTRQDGSVTATAIFQDISDSKRIQALHIRAERLQAVAELSASLAHEIRNPLASIRSATEQLARRRAQSLAPTADDDDERILHDLVVREADRLSRLLADFLDFARARVTRVSRLDLGAIVNTAAMLAASHPDRRDGVKVQVSVAPELPPVEGDEDLLHRAVFNLVLNAVQAVGPEGNVFIEVDRYRPTGEHGAASAMLTGELLTVSVTDDGPGVPPELKDRLFEPFVTGKAGGTGLGLPVVHRAVEAHRGVVLLDSLTSGTRFTLLLPIATDHDATRRGETPVYNAVPFEPHPDVSVNAWLPRLSGVAP